MSYLYLCLLVVQYFEDSKQLWSYTDLNVSTALYILLVMRISIVILYLIVVHGYIEYKKRPPQSDTSVHVCVFVLYIAVMVIFHFHIVSLCFLTIFYGNSFVASLWQSNPVVCTEDPRPPLSKTLDSQRVEPSQDPIPCLALRWAVLCSIVPWIVFDSLSLVHLQLTNVVLVCRTPFRLAGL